jgi:hypothetical protein
MGTTSTREKTLRSYTNEFYEILMASNEERERVRY